MIYALLFTLILSRAGQVNFTKATNYLALVFWALALGAGQLHQAFAENQRSHHSKPLFKKHAHKKPPPITQSSKPVDPAGAEGDGASPFEPKLERLAEILGALSYLQPLCGSKQNLDWEGQTMALIETETKSDLEKDTITGAYNHGFRGYALSYSVCTPNAQKIISRFISEGANLSQDIITRYGSS
jgi:uncharacterized protein (TIGR02301 family)